MRVPFKSVDTLQKTITELPLLSTWHRILYGIDIITSEIKFKKILTFTCSIEDDSNGQVII